LNGHGNVEKVIVKNVEQIYDINLIFIEIVYKFLQWEEDENAAQ
jgi:hypothetical protein